MRTTLIASMIRMHVGLPTITWNAIYNRHTSSLHGDFDGDSLLSGKMLAHKHRTLGNR